MLLAPEVGEIVDEIGLSWLLEGSSFGPFCLAVAMGIFAEVDWTGLGLLDTWFPYCWESARYSTCARII